MCHTAGGARSADIMTALWSAQVGPPGAVRALSWTEVEATAITPRPEQEQEQAAVRASGPTAERTGVRFAVTGPSPTLAVKIAVRLTGHSTHPAPEPLLLMRRMVPMSMGGRSLASTHTSPGSSGSVQPLHLRTRWPKLRRFMLATSPTAVTR